MAKLSAIDKNIKRKKAILSKKENRLKMSKLFCTSDDILVKLKIMKYLDKTSLCSYIKYRNRCAITGRPRGFRGVFGISRNALRHYASFGLIMGVKKNN